MEAVDYKKKIELCEKLGANKFQKVVFKVEELKYKVIKTFFPRYIEWYDKLCDRKKKKELKKAKTKEEQKKIIDHYRMQKMIMRKEFHREQNRNYHMDPNKPTEITIFPSSVNLFCSLKKSSLNLVLPHKVTTGYFLFISSTSLLYIIFFCHIIYCFFHTFSQILRF